MAYPLRFRFSQRVGRFSLRVPFCSSPQAKASRPRGRVLRSAEPHPHPGRLLSESIALAEAHGSTATLDGDFARDLEEIIRF